MRCKLIRFAVLALRWLHCFLISLHTCRGYEQGINISGSTHFHLTLTSLSLSLSFSKPSENIGGSLYWFAALGFRSM